MMLRMKRYLQHDMATVGQFVETPTAYCKMVLLQPVILIWYLTANVLQVMT